MSAVVGEEGLPFEGWILEPIRDAIGAIGDEIEASIAKNEMVDLADGRPAGRAGPAHLWSFEVDRDLAPAPDSPGTLVVPGRDPISIRVWAVGDDTIVLGLSEDAGEVIPTARLSLDPAFVLTAVRDRLQEMAFGSAPPGELIQQFLAPDEAFAEEADAGGSDPPGHLDADAEQQRAARRATEPGLRFTWGPPGTGKTRVLAMATVQAMAAGGKVLVLAHANAAVDVAVGRIIEHLHEMRDGMGMESGLPAPRPGEVLRLGTPTPDLALAHPTALPEHVVSATHPELAERLETLRSDRARLSDEIRRATDEERPPLSRRLAGVRAEIEELGSRVRDEIQGLVVNASVIGTTLATAMINDSVWDWPADVVIVDEASMAGLPFVLALALRNATTLSCFGDFRQLPPIAIGQGERAQRWFGRDVFEFCDVIERHELGLIDERLSVLRVQFRMGEMICESLNRLAYDALLRTHPTAQRRGIHLAEVVPEAGVEVVVVDLAGAGAACEVERAPDAFSRVNPLSAAVSVSLAALMSAGSAGRIGLLSPYRAQTKLMGAVARNLAAVTAATIHRFQGAECDGIVFDLTDGYDQRGPSRLTGKDNELAMRLLNVAASRAKGKLVIVVDTEFLEDRHSHLSKSRELLAIADDLGERVVLDDLIGSFDDGMVTWGGIDTAIAALTSRELVSPIEINLGSWDSAPSAVRVLIEAAPHPERVLVHGTFAAVRDLQSTQAQLSLQPAGLVPWAIAEDRVVVASTELDGPAATLASERTVRVVRDLLSPGA